eukprot:NODE_28459_length_476_cov_3.968481.p1 GENE.NODE_28459_length_476_cov_3.968481~~NODE_28459_length_476_cov_3.968481.p1  ORF type:complete len:55 (-),score=20.23 NODE_28459_length_476_cov_3.968481:100-264(-)
MPMPASVWSSVYVHARLVTHPHATPQVNVSSSRKKKKKKKKKKLCVKTQTLKKN